MMPPGRAAREDGVILTSIIMHWKKNRIVHPEAKDQIIQEGRCPGCGTAVKFYYGESGQFCPDCRKEAMAAWKEDRTERLNERVAEKKRNR
jgi:hypothetical protein